MINGSQKVKQQFQQLRTEGEKTFGGIQSRAGQASMALQRTGQAAQKASVDLKGMTLSMVGLATTTVGVVTSLSNLDRAAARVEKAEIAVQRIEDQIASTRAVLNRLTSQGKTATEQYQVQTDRLATALADLKVKQQDVKLQQDALSDTQVLFATTIINTTINSLFLMRAAFGDLTKAQLVNIGVSIKSRLAAIATSLGFKGMAGSAVGASSAVAGLNVQITLLERHPIVLALIAGLAVGFVAWETNVLGLRDALGNLLGKEMLPFSESLRLMTDQILGTDEATKQLNKTLDPGLANAADAGTSSIQGLIGSPGGGVGGGGGTGLAGATSITIALNDELFRLADRAKKIQRLDFQSDFLNAFTGFTLPSGEIGPGPLLLEQNNELIEEFNRKKGDLETTEKRLVQLAEALRSKEEAGNELIAERKQIFQILIEQGEITSSQADREMRIFQAQIGFLKRKLDLTKEIAEEQKKSLPTFSTIADLFSELPFSGDLDSSRFFGLNGAFVEKSAQRALELLGFVGEEVTINGQTFRSRVLAGATNSIVNSENIKVLRDMIQAGDRLVESRIAVNMATLVGQLGGNVSQILTSIQNQTRSGNAISAGMIRAVSQQFGEANRAFTATRGGELEQGVTFGLGFKFATPRTSTSVTPSFGGANVGGGGVDIGTANRPSFRFRIPDTTGLNPLERLRAVINAIVTSSFGRGSPKEAAVLVKRNIIATAQRLGIPTAGIGIFGTGRPGDPSRAQFRALMRQIKLATAFGTNFKTEIPRLREIVEGFGGEEFGANSFKAIFSLLPLSRAGGFLERAGVSGTEFQKFARDAGESAPLLLRSVENFDVALEIEARKFFIDRQMMAAVN